MMGQRRHPGYLSKYARHAGISVEAARKQLQRLGINYYEPFEFGDADRRREAARHADRIPFAKPIYAQDDNDDGNDVADSTKTDPKFIESQARREMFRAKLIELEYLEQVGTLVKAEDVDREWVCIASQVRDGLLNLPARLSGELAAETDQRKVHDILERAIYQALEELGKDKTVGGTHG